MARRLALVASFAVIATAGFVALLQRQQPAAAQPQISCTQDSDCPEYAPLCQASRCVVPPPVPGPRPAARGRFAVTTSAIGACLQSVDPSRARVGEPTDLAGLRFGSGGQVEFSALSGGFTPATSTGPWSSTAVADARVPAGSITGTVRVNPASAGASNELAFRVVGSTGGDGPGGGVDPESCVGPAACGVDSDCSSPPNSLPPTEYGCAATRTPRCCQARPRVTAAYPLFGASDVCLNAAVTITFSSPLDSARGRDPNLVLFQTSDDGGASWENSPARRSVAGNVLIVSPSSCSMSAGQLYRVVLRGGADGEGLRTRQGVSLQCDGSWAPGTNGSVGGCGAPPNAFDYVLGFTADAAGAQCTVDRADSLPDRQTVGVAEAARFDAVGRDSRGRAICANQVSWTSLPPLLPGLTVAPEPPNVGTGAVVTAGTTEGSQQIQATIATPAGPRSDQSTLVVTAGSPRVAGSTSCTAGQSPSPRPGRTDACVNSMVQVRFTMPMEPSSVAAGLQLLRCGASQPANPLADCSPVAGTPQVLDDRLTFAPGADLQPDTWYLAVVPASARARDTLGGRPLADLNFNSDGDSANDLYAWWFKTRTSSDRCQIQSVEVDPDRFTFTSAGQTHDFASHAVNRDQCGLIVTPNSWTWNVLNPGVATLDSSSGNSATVRAVANGSTQLQARLAGFSAAGAATLNVQLPNPLRLGTVDGGQCRNSLVTVVFTRVLDASTVPGNIEVQELVGATWTSINATVQVAQAGNGRTEVTLVPPGMLATSSQYRLWVRGDDAATPSVIEGVRDQIGQALQDSDGSYPAEVTVGLGTPPREVCGVARVEIRRSAVPVVSDTFLCAGANNCPGDDDGSAAGNQHRFRAQARAASGDVITASYSWSVPRGGSLVTVSPSPANTQDVALTAGSQNGNATLVAQATAGASSGRGSVGVRLFLCRNPWPAADPATGNWTPFMDSDTGFSLFYCRDDGSPATVDDDLPALPNPTRRTTGGDLFREIIFLQGGSGGEVAGGNAPPYLDYLPPVTVGENELVSFFVDAHDPEGDTISFASDPSFNPMVWSPVSPVGPQLLNLGDSALFSWQPTLTQGDGPEGYYDYVVTFRARDSAGAASAGLAVPIRVVDMSMHYLEPAPAAPTGLQATFASGDLEYARANVSWNVSNFADTYRVYRRNDGPAGGGDGNEEDISYLGQPGGLLQRLVQAVGSWFNRHVVSPIARVLNVPTGFAAAVDIEPSGSYVEVLPNVPSSGCSGRCSGWADLQAPVSRRLCYAVKACNEAGCSAFSAPVCGDAPPPNTLPSVSFVSPATPGQRIPLGTPFTFRAQLAEADAGDHLASYQWFVDGVAQPASTGDFGSSETVDLTRTFSAAGVHTVSIRAADSNGAYAVPDPSTSVDAQPNAAPNSCIIDPSGSLPPWCST